MNLRLDIPEEVMEEIVALAAARVLAEIASAPASRWLTGAKAAAA